MHYVYILKSHKFNKDHFYVGYTSDLKRRFQEHNNGKSPYTAKYKPWELINYFAFVSEQRAKDFEAYLKTRAGRMFQVRHFSVT